MEKPLLLCGGGTGVALPPELPETMLQAKLYGIGDLRLEEGPLPTIEDDEVLVRVEVCGICASDVRKFTAENYYPLKFPFNPGHEWTGTVVAVGRRHTKFQVGDRIVAEGQGGYAPYAKINAHDLRFSTRLPDEVSFEAGIFTEPLADCIHAVVHRGGVRLGDKVVVVGAGSMGLMHANVAALAGADVLVSEPDPERRALAVDFGASVTVDPTAHNLRDAVEEWTKGKGADACILTLSHPALIDEAVHLVGARGRVILFASGPVGQRISLDPNRIHYKEILLTGSHWVGVSGYSDPSLYELAVDLIARKKVNVEALITHRLPLTRIHEGFQLMQERKSLKVLVYPHQEAPVP